jgi:hypothetical protein
LDVSSFEDGKQKLIMEGEEDAEKVLSEDISGSDLTVSLLITLWCTSFVTKMYVVLILSKRPEQIPALITLDLEHY